MKMMIFALPLALLSLRSIDLAAQSAAPASPAVSRVHQLEIEDQSEILEISQRRISTGTGMRVVRRFANFLQRESSSQGKIFRMLR